MSGVQQKRPAEGPGQPTRGWSLRAWIVFANAVVLTLVFVLGSTIAMVNLDEAVDDLAGQLQRRVALQVEEHLRSYLGTPHTVIQLMADALDLSQISLEDPAGVHRYLYRLAQLFPGISYFNIATEDGRFYGLGRVDNRSDELVIEEAALPQLDVLRQYDVDAEGNRAGFRKELPFSDHREQVWYAQPRALGRPAWTAIYSWIDNPGVIVASAGVPVHGRVEGVVGVDMFLANINVFLASLRISPAARAFIMERDGALVASSRAELPFRDGPGGATRLRAAEAEDFAIRQAVRALEGLDGGLAGIDGVLGIEVGLPDAWYVTSLPWRDPRGLDWLIVVTLPESDFTDTMLAKRRRALVLGGLLMLVATGLSLATASYVARPLQRIEQAARDIAGGDFEATVESSSIREVNHLVHSFNAMSARLRDAFARLAQSRGELEQEVVRRTEELRLANEELERLSREDSLTGLANRRCFDPRLREEWLRARRAGESLSLVVCDIDFFKAYNDRYGHSAGDIALRQVAGVLAANLRRASDLAARYGGEEFVLLLPATDMADALEVAGVIREQILELAISHEASPHGCVSVSFGVACHSPANSFPAPDQLFKAADQALYRAKDHGRNCIEVAGPISVA